MSAARVAQLHRRRAELLREVAEVDLEIASALDVEAPEREPPKRRHGDLATAAARACAAQSPDIAQGASVVYAIQAGVGGPIKIGTTTHLQRRFAQLQASNPYRLTLLAVAPGDQDDEGRWHGRLRRHRLRGEWFHPSAAVLAAVREIRALQPGDRGLSEALLVAVREHEARS